MFTESPEKQVLCGHGDLWPHKTCFWLQIKYWRTIYENNTLTTFCKRQLDWLTDSQATSGEDIHKSKTIWTQLFRYKQTSLYRTNNCSLHVALWDGLSNEWTAEWIMNDCRVCGCTNTNRHSFLPVLMMFHLFRHSTMWWSTRCAMEVD